MISRLTSIVLLRSIHFAQDRGKPRIRAQRAVLRKVSRPKNEWRLAFVPRTMGECNRLFTLPGSLSRDGKMRSRNITSHGAIQQFAMQRARL